MKQQQGTLYPIFPSFLRTSSKYPPPLILALPKKKPPQIIPPVVTLQSGLLRVDYSRRLVRSVHMDAPRPSLRLWRLFCGT